ncbi:DUF386 domain-containing protein [Apibacter muscae]|uniref:DUF386 domain-containing protein n=1 Tax=Apibacter muscae TaxID=2509004 RepID=A0A563D8J4_9FLAO|nr:YhcH/YjgK/YiaL family protein [Apibacter muscae]TWP26566.1 DUF386 domain-containing protein [Apibacter muscae]
MIIDSLNNISKYTALHPLFPKAFEYIQNLDIKNLKIGTFPIQNQDIFAIINESAMGTIKDTHLEAHNQYIDIQVPFSKTEMFGWAPRSILRNPLTEYDEIEDIQYFKDHYSFTFELQPENFVIFFPQDAHAPCLGEGNILKLVIKIKVIP